MVMYNACIIKYCVNVCHKSEKKTLQKAVLNDAASLARCPWTRVLDTFRRLHALARFRLAGVLACP